MEEFGLRRGFRILHVRTLRPRYTSRLKNYPIGLFLFTQANEDRL